jgi:hypothetical protein
MPEHPLAPTTHTLDMAQIAQLNERLSAPGAAPITMADLGVAAAGVPSSAVLTKVWWEGSPEFPYIYGDLSAAAGGGTAPAHVLLHTQALRALSQALGLHHRWGV